MKTTHDLDHLPGGALIQDGLTDLRAGRESVAALLVSIGAPKLRRLSFDVPTSAWRQPEHRLYHRLATDHADEGHSRYNALIRQLVSFTRAAQCER